MLEIEGLTKAFGGLIAVTDVALTVPEGKIISLIGPNGAGKTTLFAIVSGFLKPDRGQVRFLGDEITGLTPHAICRRGLVRTFQVVQPFANLTVRDNIAVGAQNRLRRRRDALERAAEIAERLGMSGQLDQMAGALTVAGRKRLELARALATGPQMLLLDEVMAGLNAIEIDEIAGVIRDIRASGITIFLIEHVMQAVMSLSDYTFVLNNGAIISQGRPDQVAADAVVIEAYLGHGAAERIAQGESRA